MSKRFKYYFPSQIIKDMETGQRHYGNKQVVDLLNELNELNEESAKFNLEDAVYQLGVLLIDETTGIIPKTLKKNFNEEYKNFDTITAWECLVDEINRINAVAELHDYLVDNLESLKELK